jgi:hypothetical protein
MKQEMKAMLAAYGEYVKCVEAFREAADDSVLNKLIDFSIIEDMTADLGDHLAAAHGEIKKVEHEERAAKYADAYGVFMIADRLQYFDYGYDLDELWARASVLYFEFLDSEFNVDSKSEMDCIADFLQSNDLL